MADQQEQLRALLTGVKANPDARSATTAFSNGIRAQISATRGDPAQLRELAQTLKEYRDGVIDTMLNGTKVASASATGSAPAAVVGGNPDAHDSSAHEARANAEAAVDRAIRDANEAADRAVPRGSAVGGEAAITRGERNG